MSDSIGVVLGDANTSNAFFCGNELGKEGCGCGSYFMASCLCVGGRATKCMKAVSLLSIHPEKDKKANDLQAA